MRSIVYIGVLGLIACETNKEDTEEVIINTSPACEILSPEDGIIGEEGDVVQFSATASDAESSPDQLSVVWISDKDGEIGSSIPTTDGEISFSFSELSINPHTITLQVTDADGATCTTGVNYTVGTVPDVTIESPGDGEIYSEGESLDFIVMVSDGQDDPDELNLEWELNGETISNQAADSSGSAQITEDSLAFGEYTFFLRATDSHGLKTSRGVIFVVNGVPTAPVISILPDPATTTDPLSIQLDTESSDPEGEEITYTYEWFLNGELQTDYTSDSLPSVVTNKGEEWTAKVTPSDGIVNGEAGEISIIIQNSEPQISDVNISYSGNLHTEAELTCNYTASDADGDALSPSYVWTNITQNIEIGSGSNTLQLSPSLVSPADEVLCSVSVTDEEGATISLSALDVVENTVPQFISTPVISGTGTQVGDTWTCSASGEDQDDGILTPTYEWQDANGGLIGSGDSLTLDASNSSPNTEIYCIALLTDSSGVVVSASVSEMVSNTAPSFDTPASISPNTGVFTSTLLSCTGGASDADGDTPALSYHWETVNGMIPFATNDTLQLSTSIVIPDEEIFCVVTATDDQGEITTSTTSVLVENTLPVVAVSITTNGTTNTGELTCLGTATDADDGFTVPTIGYEWSNADGSLGFNSVLQLTPNQGVDGDAITCTVTATDLSGGSSIATAQHIITNSAPEIDSISFSESSINSGTSSITCETTASDTDLDPVTQSFVWSVEGSPQQETSNVFSGPFVLGETITCQATPNDGKSDGDSEEVSLVVENAPPVVDSIILSSNTVYTNDTIAVTAVLTDTDSSQAGDLTATYSWWVVDGEFGTLTEVQSGTDNTLSGVTHFDRDDEVSVIITPNDGVEDGDEETSSSIFISNSIPVISSVELTPDPAVAKQDDLTCVVTASDDDGDTLLYDYVWTRATGLVDTTLATAVDSDEIPAMELLADDWTCEVSVSDGTDDGNTESDVATVENGCGALSFGGADLGDNVSLPFPPMMQWTEATHEAWVYLEGATTYGVVFLNEDAFICQFAGSSGYGVRQNHWICGYYDPNGSIWLTSIDEAAFNEWTHLAVQFDQGLISMYVNGVLQESEMSTQSNVRSPPNNGPYEFKIGDGSSENYPETHDGLISRVRISSTARYGQNFIPATSWNPDPQTELLWLMGEADGGLVIDDSENNFNGNVDGAVWVDACPDGGDIDGDGFSILEDCNDNDATIYPLANDVFGDGVDSDCDGLDCEAMSDGSTYFAVCRTSDASADSVPELQDSCISMGYDGLASILDSTENAFIASLGLGVTTSSNGSIFVGGTDQNSEGNWEWFSGLPWGYENWNSGEPNDSLNNEDYLALNISTLTWNDWRVESHFYDVKYACEKR